MSKQSPFPGMDRYLEQHWRDVHAGLIVYSSNQIQVKLPDDLVARINERDLFLIDPGVPFLKSERATETFIEIQELDSGNRIITIIEFLTPSAGLCAFPSKTRGGP